MAGPAIQVAPPPRHGRTGGIEAVATFRPNERLGAAGGLVFQSDGCAFPREDAHLCYVNETPIDKTFTGIDNIAGIGDPFALYGAVQCFAGPDADFEERARAALQRGRYRTLEWKLSQWALGATPGATQVGVEMAVAMVEQRLDADYVDRGVILMSAFDAVMADAAGILERTADGYPITIKGTPVIATGVMDPGVVIGVGEVVVEHSGVTAADVINPETNAEWALAEQVFALLVDCSYRVVVPFVPAGGGVDPAIISRIEVLESEVITLQSELDGKVESVVAGAGITVDPTDPKNPVVSAE